MKYLLLILPFFTFAQNKAPRPIEAFTTKYNSEVHFYGSCLINDAAYSIQGLIWPNRKPAKKLLISNAITLSCITLKEVYDIRKPKPTGWSWDDWLIGVWAMAIYCIVRICINDFRKPKEIINLEP
jgi:hypothetical protein